MAIVKNIVVNVDTKAAVSEVNKLDKSFENLDTQTEKTTTGLKDVGENGGAIAVLDSLTGGLATRFRDAYEATKLFNFSLKGTRAALLASGIGALVLLTAAIVINWDKINDFMEGTSKRLDNQLRQYENITNELEHQQKINKLDQDIAKAKGESTVELIRLERELLIEKQKINGESLINLEAQLAIEQSKVREITLVEKGLIALKAYVFGYDSIAQSAADAMGLTTVSELQTRINELREIAKQTELEIANIDNEQRGDGVVRGQQTELTGGLTPEDLTILSSKEILFDELSLLQSGYANEVKANAVFEVNQAQQVKAAKIAIVRGTLGIIGMLAKEGSELAKGIAASQATINTILGVTSALSAPSTIPEPFGTILKFVNAAAIGVSGAINVKKILATKPVITGGGGGGRGGAQAPAPPSFNLVQGTQGNQIANSLQNQEPVQAIVVSRNVTSAQEADRNSENNSTL